MSRRATIATIATIATVTASSGCFTSWAGMRLGGNPGAWDENVREETVPLPGITERLVVALPLRSPTVEIECNSIQNGNDAIYHSAYRYGSGWKKATGIMFLAEAALGAVLLATDANTKPGNVVLGAFLAADGLGTGIIFFVPKKEIYRRDEKAVTTSIRGDCPDGLALDIAGESFPVDAAGHIGEVGDAAFDAWLEESQPAAPVASAGQVPQAGPYAPPAYGAPVTQTAPASAAAVATAPPGAAPGPLLVSLDGKSQELGLGFIDRCVLNHVRHPETQPCSSTNTLVTAMFEVPVGTLGRVASTQ